MAAPQRPRPRRRRRTWSLPRASRDTVLFAGGLAGVFHETVIGQQERPALLVLFAGMMGLPAFLRYDEARNDAEDDDPEVKP